MNPITDHFTGWGCLLEPRTRIILSMTFGTSRLSMVGLSTEENKPKWR